jgi:hypothetical protein
VSDDDVAQPLPSTDQVRRRIDELMTRSPPPGSPPDPAVQTELDQLWQWLRERDLGPESEAVREAATGDRPGVVQPPQDRPSGQR